MKTKTDAYLEEILERFRKEFVQDHNRGEERFLRGLFIHEFEDFISKEFKEYAKNLNEDKNNRFHF